ncbi:MAG: hypothetical protein AseanaTS_16420 [Candidatus Pelagadaptatus aseana]|uniref:ATP-binding protein n=1 Tax=Candidatus Pelagadaptatus aseana TaxID=3120508 RepID=UPI0039B141A5
MTEKSVEPELELISSQKTGQRLMLIALLLIIPLVGLVFLYLEELNDKRQQLENQLTGIDSLHRLHHIHDHFIDVHLPRLKHYSTIEHPKHDASSQHLGLPELQQQYQDFEALIEQQRHTQKELTWIQLQQDFQSNSRQLQQLYYQSILDSGLLLISSDQNHQKVDHIGSILPRLHNALTSILLNTEHLTIIDDITLANNEVKKHVRQVNEHRSLITELDTAIIDPEGNVLLAKAVKQTMNLALKIAEKVRRNLFFGLQEQNTTDSDLTQLYQLTATSLHLLDQQADKISDSLVAALQKNLTNLKQMQFFVLTLVSSLIILSCLLFYYITTNIRQSQSALQNQNRMLEEGIFQRTEELFDAKRVTDQLNQDLIKQSEKSRELAEVATRANQAKTLFLAAMSHEIRTPMNAVLGGANQLTKTSLDDKQKDALLLIQRSGETLMDIINDILDFSKIESGEMQLEQVEFDLEKITTDLMTIFSGRAQEKQIVLHYRFDASCEGTWQGDPTRIKQIIMNLLSNAIKFTDEGQVTLDIDKSGDGCLQCTISDTGIGIKQEAIPHLFEAFTQAENNITRRFGGSGLGLSICKKLAELMGSEISVKSIFGQGSIFRIDMPISQTSAPSEVNDKSHILLLDPQKNYTSLPLWGLSNIDIIEDDTTLADSGKHGDVVITTSEDLVTRCHSETHLPTILLSSSCSRATLIDPGTESLIIRAPLYAPNKTLRQLIEQIQQPDALRTLSGEDQNSEVLEQEQITLNGKVLLVEDVEFNQIIACDLLEDLGLEVACANNGQEAVEKFQQERFDMILMDIHMPVMDGIEATRAIRLNEQQQQRHPTPIVALTADVIKDTYDQIQQCGMDDYLSKPIDEVALETTIRKFLEPAQ